MAPGGNNNIRSLGEGRRTAAWALQKNWMQEIRAQDRAGLLASQKIPDVLVRYRWERLSKRSSPQELIGPNGQPLAVSEVHNGLVPDTRSTTLLSAALVDFLPGGGVS